MSYLIGFGTGVFLTAAAAVLFSQRLYANARDMNLKATAAYRRATAAENESLARLERRKSGTP